MPSKTRSSPWPALAAMLIVGCSPAHEALQMAETFSWCDQPITFSPPPSRWYREGDNGGGMLGVRFVLRNGGGQCISVAAFRSFAERNRKAVLTRLIARRDSLDEREFMHELSLARPRTDDPLSEREGNTAIAINAAIDRAVTDFYAGQPGFVASDLESAVRLASEYQMTLEEILPRIRLRPERMPHPDWWRTGYERDTTIAGLPAYATDDTLITPERPLLYHEVFWVVNGYGFKAVYQGTAENLPMFHRILETVTFPPPAYATIR